MLTTDNTYSINRGRAQNSTNIGIYAPDRFGDFLLPVLNFGGAENTTGASRIISRECLHVLSPRNLAGLGNFSKKANIMQNQLTFKNHTFTPIIVNNQPYFGVLQIGVALNYARPELVNKVYNNHADEFTPDMSFLTTIDPPGGKQQVRVFSLRGCHLLAMFSKTPVAKEFRRWVLDLIEQHNTTPALPDMKSLGGLVKSCAAAAMRAEFEKAMTDMVYTERFKSIIREALKQTVDDDFEFGVWKDIVASSLAARCSNMVREKEKQLRQKIAAEILETK